MTIQSLLLKMLRTVAEALEGDLRRRLVFVGGCTTALFITDEITIESVRATDDVDLIVDLAGYAEWVELQRALRDRGFKESPEDTVACRMRLGAVKVDFMPNDPDILGFSNRWYAKGIRTAVHHPLTETLSIRRLTPELFVATKLEAWLGRGHGDLIRSYDIEDIVLIVDGRKELGAEIARADDDIRGFIAAQFASLLANPDFAHLLEGNIRTPPGRAEIVRQRFVAMAGGA